jgi:hypothetical protein
MNVNYPCIELLKDMKHGDSFFYKGLAYTICGEVPQEGMVECFCIEASKVFKFNVLWEVRRVDVETIVSEWTGYDEDEATYEPKEFATPDGDDPGMYSSPMDPDVRKDSVKDDPI